MDVLIRPATGADFDEVGRVFGEENRFHANLLPEIFEVAEPIMTPEWYEALLSDPDQTLYVAELEHEIVGLLLLREMANPDDPIFRPRRYAYVDEVAVAQAHRRRGIGRRLMEQALQWARERGLGTIELNVWAANPGAIEFYRRLGYGVIRHRMRREIDTLQA